MHTRRNLLIIAAIVIGLIALALFARQNFNPAMLIDGDNVIFADEYTLNEAVQGDLIVVARVILLGADADVSGSVSLIGSDVTVAGRIEENLTVLGENILLNEESRITGNASLMGTITLVDGTIGGTLLVNSDITNLTGSLRAGGEVLVCAAEITAPDALTVAPCPEENAIQPFEPLLDLRRAAPSVTAALNPLVTAISVFVWAVAMTGLATIAVTAFPRHISRIEDAVRTRPRRFWGVGVALYGFGAGITLALITLLAILPPIGLILLPVYLIALVLLVALTLCGLITLALVIGDVIIARMAGSRLPPLVTAVTGSLVLSAGLALLVLLPFGWLADVLIVGAISAVGLGASMVTRLGTRPITPTYFVQG